MSKVLFTFYLHENFLPKCNKIQMTVGNFQHLKGSENNMSLVIRFFQISIFFAKMTCDCSKIHFELIGLGRPESI